MSEKVRAALVEGCCKPAKGFEEWVAAHTKSSTNIGEIFEGLSSKQRVQLFGGLLIHAQSIQGIAQASTLNSVAWTYSKLLPCLPRTLPSQAAEALAHIAKHLMPFFCEEQVLVLDAVLHVMETWWMEDRDGKTDIAQSTVEGLIYLCFSSHGKPKDVRRLVNVQDALIFCGASTHIAVQKCLQHPMFTLSPEGRKFLSFAASSSVPLASAFSSSILQQLPASRKNMLDSFGQIMFGAWNSGDADVRSSIEMSFVQELAHRICVVASESVAVAGRRVLRAWHHSKDVPTVDETLLRLYEPFIWRLLAAANARVRRNTALLFIEAMPLQDPNAPVSYIDDLLQKQFAALHTLLADPAVIVREAGVQGAFRIMGVYWELLPPATTRALLLQIVSEHACDAAAPAVRAAVCDGMRFLVDNPLSLVTLQTLLPRVSHLINDSSERVRVAMVTLLDTVKGIKGIRYYDIVAPDALLNRLAADVGHAPVATKLSALLCQSLWPANKNLSEQAPRFIALIKRNRAAAVAFCTHCLPAIGFDQACRLALFLVRCVFVPAAGLPAPPAEVQAAIEPAASKRGRGKGAAAAAAAAAALVASQAAADSADAEMRQDLAGDEMKSAAACIVALCESLQKVSSEEQRSALNDRMQDVVAKSSKEAVMQSLGGDLLWHVAAALPGLKGLKTLNDRAAESLACGAAGDNELFLVGRWFLVVGRGQALLKICTQAIAAPAGAAAAGPRMAEDAAVWLLHALTAAPQEASLFAGSASLAARKEAIQACLAAAASCEDVEKATAFVCCAVRLSILVGPDDNVAMLAPMAEWVVANAASPTATAALHKAVKRAKADSAPVDPDRVSNLASAVICGLCDTAATGRWLQQHLDAALLLVSCVPASTFASVSPYCCKLVTLLAPQHSSAGSRLAASAASLALQGAAEDSVSQLMQSARACIAAASDGGDLLAALQPWIALHASDSRAFAAFAAAAAGWGCGIAVAEFAREQSKGDGASAAAWMSLSSQLPPAPSSSGAARAPFALRSH